MKNKDLSLNRALHGFEINKSTLLHTKAHKIQSFSFYSIILCVVMLLMALSFATPFRVNNVVKAEIPSSVRVIYSSINAYSVANVNSPDVQIVATFKYNQKLTTIGDQLVQGEDGLDYYMIALADVAGFDSAYVLKSQVVDANANSPQKKLDANATIAKQGNVYVLNENTYEQTEEILKEGTKVKILSGYDREKEYTQIQYQLEDGDIVTAYIKTECLKTSGISRTLIGAILIIITTISLVFIIFGVGGKRKKKRA